MVDAEAGRPRAEKLFGEALKALEEIGAIPDLCEGYLTFAIYQIRLGRSVEARFYLSQAQTLIKSSDYQPLEYPVSQCPRGALSEREALH